LPGFRKLAERERYRGSLISVASGTFEAPDGTVFDRDLVHHPGAVSVVPLTAGLEVLMVRQYRAPIDRELLEIPAGKRDVAGEAPATTAERELAEEVGVRASSVELLAEFFNSPGFCDEHSFVFLARALEQVASSAHSVEERHMIVEAVALGDVEDLIRAGQIVDAKTIIGLTLAKTAVI
jgi:ADP-ribose pyrophosphatase